MTQRRSVALIAIALGWGTATHAAPVALVAGYELTKISPDYSASSPESLFYGGITQLTFKPGDNAHVYAARSQYSRGNFFGEVTRYDYNATTGKLTNPVDVAANLPGTQGLAFNAAGDLYVSTNHNVGHPDGSGGIERLTTTGNGMYGNGVEFVNNIPVVAHFVDQLQIYGDSLYVGIGTKTNNGDPVVESAYNGTISRISDLSQANYSGTGANNLPLEDVVGDTQPGKLNLYATGFRNPFGLRVDEGGHVWVSDNGADTPFLTPDYLYKDVPFGAKGLFPPGNGGTFQPLANLGLDTSADGFATLGTGSHAGDTLIALFSPASPNSSVAGQQVLAINPTTGSFVPFVADLTNPLAFNPLEVIRDPFGNILIADYGPSFYSRPYNTPENVGIYLLRAVPEPSSASLLAIVGGLAGAGTLARRRGRGRRLVGTR